MWKMILHLPVEAVSEPSTIVNNTATNAMHIQFADPFLMTAVIPCTLIIILLVGIIGFMSVILILKGRFSQGNNITLASSLGPFPVFQKLWREGLGTRLSSCYIDSHHVAIILFVGHNVREKEGNSEVV